MKNLIIILTATLIAVCNLGVYLILHYGGSLARFNSTKISDNPKPCKYEDSECIIGTMNSLKQEQSQGESSLNPVRIDLSATLKITIEQGEKSPITFDLKFTNQLIFGLKDAVVFEINRDFGKDLTQKHEMAMKLKEFGMIADYSISRPMLFLPISETGKSNITLINSDLKITFSGVPLEQNGETYMKIDDLKFNIIPERLIYNFSNLFNGYEEVGYNINVSENEHARFSFWPIFAQIFEDVINNYISNIINNVFKKYPYEKYFAKE